MWAKTIASVCRRGRAVSRALAARLITGPGAFLVAGLLDLLAAIWWLKVRARSQRTSQGRDN